MREQYFQITLFEHISIFLLGCAVVSNVFHIFIICASPACNYPSRHVWRKHIQSGLLDWSPFPSYISHENDQKEMRDWGWLKRGQGLADVGQLWYIYMYIYIYPIYGWMAIAASKRAGELSLLFIMNNVWLDLSGNVDPHGVDVLELLRQFFIEGEKQAVIVPSLSILCSLFFFLFSIWVFQYIYIIKYAI